jgi:hypothetical protein
MGEADRATAGSRGVDKGNSPSGFFIVVNRPSNTQTTSPRISAAQWSCYVTGGR